MCAGVEKGLGGVGRGTVLGDEVMAAALIEWILHHCHIVNIRGDGNRVRAHQDLVRARSDDKGRSSVA